MLEMVRNVVCHRQTSLGPLAKNDDDLMNPWIVPSTAAGRGEPPKYSPGTVS